MNLTFAFCTYNRAERLPVLIAGLHTQASLARLATKTGFDVVHAPHDSIAFEFSGREPYLAGILFLVDHVDPTACVQTTFSISPSWV
jgi:hypothetical protein